MSNSAVPAVTVKAFAELMNVPVYSQLSIIGQQKYPRRTPAIFQVPYYAETVRAIRRYYRNGSNLRPVDEAIMVLQTMERDAKRDNDDEPYKPSGRGNTYVHRASFVRPEPSPCHFGVVNVRLTPDLVLERDGRSLHLL